MVRAPAIRGALRFWWRALYAAKYPDARALFRAEAELWGTAGVSGGASHPSLPPARSPVEVSVEVIGAPPAIAFSPDRFSDSREHEPPELYVLWALRGGQKVSAARYRPHGTRFRLRLALGADPCRRAEVIAAVKAWLLFGGYGARVRRGVGSLRETSHPTEWLPSGLDRADLTAFFGRDVLAPKPAAAGPTARLAGAGLAFGRTTSAAHDAWRTAAGWLRDFRTSLPPRTRIRLGFTASRGEPSRLASPLIVKAAALTGDRYTPVALWLNRDDAPVFPSGSGLDVRKKFFDFLRRKPGVTVAAE